MKGNGKMTQVERGLGHMKPLVISTDIKLYLADLLLL